MKKNMFLIKKLLNHILLPVLLLAACLPIKAGVCGCKNGCDTQTSYGLQEPEQWYKFWRILNTNMKDPKVICPEMCAEHGGWNGQWKNDQRWVAKGQAPIKHCPINKRDLEIEKEL